MYEVTHIQEVLDALAKLIEDPLGLPSASEQVILDVKSSEAGWSFRTPPGSPTSVGSRKSSTCSISSLNSSSSDSTHSPSSHQRSRSLSQLSLDRFLSLFTSFNTSLLLGHLPVNFEQASSKPPSGAFRLLSVSSQDSGFTSQDTLFTRLPTPPPLELADQVNPALKVVEDTVKESPSYPDAPSAMATWPNLQDTLQFEKAAASIAKSQRPHTISSAYERHNRPIITTHTFRPLQNDSDSQLSLSADGDCPPDLPPEDFADDCSEEATPTHKAYPPPLPLRAEEMDLSAPTVPPKPRVLMQQPKKLDLQAACSSGNNPIYVNASDICSASKPSTPVEAGSQEVSLKMSFQKDLAATLAQNAVHQKLKETTGNLNDQVIGSQNIATTPSEGACGGHAPPPPVRRSSATKQPPVVPPHRSTSGKEGTSWNVFSEITDGSDAHAQLMRALNARLDALQRDEEILQIPDRLPPPPPPLKETTLEIPPRQASLRSAPSKKLPRTPDKIGGLEMKLVSSKFHTAPRPMETTKAQRRISQPTFSELLDQFPRNRNPTEDTAPLKRLPPTPDRRSSLDLEHANAQRGLVFEAANAQRSVIFETNTKRIASGNPNEAASRVQQWLAGRGSVDVSRCHADLLGEIRGGVNLRKANSDDRSAPILRHVRIKPPK
ncbi:WH2 domain-containing protein [Trichonephila clavipes]|nr:WH2 domain-containing protein [Trichonephila clavipes]